MKNGFLLSCVFLFSAMASAQSCVESLVDSLERDSNIRVTRITDVYACGKRACAITYQHEAESFENRDAVAFMENDYGYHLNWAPVQEAGAFGSEALGRSAKMIYLEASLPGYRHMDVELSVETPREAVYKPVRRTYFHSEYRCTRLK